MNSQTANFAQQSIALVNDARARAGSSRLAVGLVAERLERMFDPGWGGWRAWLAALGLVAAVTVWAGVVAGLLVGP